MEAHPVTHKEEPTSLASEESRTGSARRASQEEVKYEKSILLALVTFLYETRLNWWMMALARCFSACAGAASNLGY